MDADDAATRFARIFTEIYRNFHRRVHHTDYQLTAESLAVLRHLAGAGPLTITECARHMDRSQAAMSEMVGRLVQRGVLHKIADERDRRRTLVWLTGEGTAKLDEADRVLSPETLTEAFLQLNDEQRARLIGDLHRLLQHGDE